MVAQTNDTDHHLHVRKKFIELQTDLMIRDRGGGAAVAEPGGGGGRGGGGAGGAGGGGDGSAVAEPGRGGRARPRRRRDVLEPVVEQVSEAPPGFENSEPHPSDGWRGGWSDEDGLGL